MPANRRPPDLDLVRRACDRLFTIPGVVSVGIGHKVVGGRSTGELALSISVLEKKPRSEVQPDELIPDQIEGVPTDVVRGGVLRLLAEEQEDFDSGITTDTGVYDPVLGGIRIRAVHSLNKRGETKAGTLGGFATTFGKDAGKRVLLTNQHVLRDDNIGEPHLPSCTGCSKGDPVGNLEKSNRFATVLRAANDSTVDAAIAVLDKGVRFQRDIINEDKPATGNREAVTDTRPLTTSDIGLEVHKRGMRTLTTYGVVGAVGLTTQPIDGKVRVNQIRIDLKNRFAGPTRVKFEANNRIEMPALDLNAATVQPKDILFVEAPPNTGRYRIDQVVDAHHLVVAANPNLKPDEGTRLIFITMPFFGLHGDSGSLVLDAQGRAVGLLFAADSSVHEGAALANPIEVVETQLQIKIDTAKTVGDTQVALASPNDPDASAPAPRLRPAAAVATDGAPPVTLRSMVEQDLTASPRGREIYQLYFRHHMEIRELIDRNRRVATVWHRQGGPGLIQLVLDAVRSRTSEIPSSIRGQTWAERVATILAVFDRFGSQRLREDIARFGREIESLGGLTYPAFLERLEA